MLANSLSSTITQIASDASKQLLSIDDLASIEHKASANKWSKKEILGHLIDSAFNNHRRFKVSLVQEHLVFDGYDQDKEVQLHRYQERTFKEIIHTWRDVNIQLSYLVASMSETHLTKETTQHNYYRIGFKQIPEGQPATLSYLIEDYIVHMEHHLRQIIGDEYKAVFIR